MTVYPRQKQEQTDTALQQRCYGSLGVGDWMYSACYPRYLRQWMIVAWPDWARRMARQWGEFDEPGRHDRISFEREQAWLAAHGVEVVADDMAEGIQRLTKLVQERLKEGTLPPA